MRRPLAIAAAAAAVLVFARSIAPLAYQGLFDSDQAIVGLMAKHLSELRTFPLFFYGQHYMLGVQAWLAAPFFWIGGPTVAMLRVPMVLVNAGVAVALVAMLARRGVHPALAFSASLPIVATSPVLTMELLTANGASVEPFASVLILWALRTRPVAFGAVLAVAVLHREFTIFALPALVVAEWPRRRSLTPLSAASAAAAFAAVWVTVELLRRAPFVGAPGAAAADTTLAPGVRTVAGWLSFEWAPYLARVRELVTWGLPDLFGVRVHPVD